MLFSLTYGPDQTGRIGLNFGPLNLSGGERRLNVAITRARERLTVFGSLRPDQIDLSRTNAIGVAHLKQFLSFAEHGPSAFKTEATGPLGDFESPFEAQVAERLRRKGWTAHPQIGVSGFRVDLGVVDPDAPGSFLAGVECDGATYHRGATARDRDRLRQAVLEGLGWRILRIWSTDWWTNAARETDRLHLALEAALVQAREKRALRDAEAAQVVAVADLEPEIELTVPAATSPYAEPGARELAEFYEESYQTRLSEIVLDVVVRLGPVREDRLIQHIARLHGFQRAGRDIRDRVISVLPPESPRTQDTSGSFVWPPDSDPTAWDRFRPPPPGEACDPADVALQELVALAKTFTARGWPLEAALTGMRDACGLKRLGETSRRRCLQAIERALVQREADKS